MINHNHYSDLLIKRYVLAFLLALFLPAFHAAGQKNSARPSDGSLKNDTVLINQYVETSQKHSTPPDRAFKLLNAAYTLAKKHGLQSKTGWIWAGIAQTNVREGNHAAAKLYLDSAFLLSKQLKDGELICFVNGIAALMYQNSSDYAKAAIHYFRTIETIKEFRLENSVALKGVYNNLASLMFSLDEDSLARKYLLLAKYHLLRESPVDSAQLSFLLVNIAQTYFNSHSPVSIGYFRKAYDHVKNRHNKAFSFHILLNLTKSYIQQKQPDSAAYYLKLARENAVTKPALVKTETAAGFISFYKKDYAAAIRHFQRSIDLDEGNNYDNMDETYQGLSWAYEERREFQKAHQFLKKYQQLTDEMKTGKEKVAGGFMLELQSLEHEKAMMQKRAEITAQEAAIKKRNLWIVAMCILSVLLCTILALAYRNYRNRKTLLNERMQTLLRDQEIDRLKAEADGADKERGRIAYDLHDGVMVRLANVKMNLNGLPPTLSEFAGSSRYQDIMSQLDMATRELRNTAHNLMPEILLEDGITQAIFYFCKATEQSSGLNITFQQIGPAFPKLQTQVETAIYRIIQGLVQNIIQHAKATSSLVQLQYSNNLCALTVEDDGQGFANGETSEGYGLKSIRNRIKVLNGTFDIESEKGRGTTVYIEFDVTPFLRQDHTNRGQA